MRLTIAWLVGTVLLLSEAVSTHLNASTADEEAFFETKIRPVLASSCIECHGPTKASGGLRLDSRDAVFQGGDNGPPVEPGNAESSLLVRAIRRDKDSEFKMPPDKPLSNQAVEDIARWIEAGAKWPESISTPIPSQKRHWAFEPLRPVEIPEDPSGWATEPIDCFIAAAQREHGVHPVGQASKQSLIRRAYFDLVGLPPTPQQIESYMAEESMADESMGGLARVVDDLLSSQRYGERWGRHWLDLVRYADTAGDNSDYPIPQAYLYRDYVIDSFNADVPYDKFLREQLAGDILAKAAPASDYARLVIATGFIAQSKRIGTRELEDMHLIIEDTLATLGPAILGLSLRCARCHDHKYDPISMEDYYGLYGFFASSQYPFAGAEEVRKQTKFAPLFPPDQVKQIVASRDTELASLKSQLESLELNSDIGKRVRELDRNQSELEKRLKETESGSQGEGTGKLDSVKSELAAARKELEQISRPIRENLARTEKQEPLAGVPTAYAIGELQPIDVPIQIGGDPRTPKGHSVRRGVPKFLDEAPLDVPPSSSGRLQLADWLTDRASFLTARVMVNRIWQNHFGKPLVPTPSDFGYRGTPPSHPELLDWLAAEFIRSGWSIKAMHRTIMSSKTYQLSSDVDEGQFQTDSGNTWYWRFDRRRLDAESLRDTVLLVSGTLDLSRPGPHPFPAPEKWTFTAHHQFNHACYPSDHRSVYLMVQRLHAHPYLSLFNGPDPSLSTPTRDNSTVPLQALYLLNNEFVHQAAAKYSRNLRAEVSDPAEQIKVTYLRLCGRCPNDFELAKRLDHLDRYGQVLQNEGMSKEQAAVESLASVVRVLFASNEFFYID